MEEKSIEWCDERRTFAGRIAGARHEIFSKQFVHQRLNALAGNAPGPCDLWHGRVAIAVEIPEHGPHPQRNVGTSM